MTLRMEGHAVHDDAFYVPKVMFEKWAESDPVDRYRSWLRENAEFGDGEEAEIVEQVKHLLNESLRRSDESPMPETHDLLEGVYAAPEDLETPHHK